VIKSRVSVEIHIKIGLITDDSRIKILITISSIKTNMFVRKSGILITVHAYEVHKPYVCVYKFPIVV
jgi:hypothetical protein